MLIIILIVSIGYIWFYEWQEVETLESNNKQIDNFRKEINGEFI